MAILDKVTSLLPWRSERREHPERPAGAMALRDDLDRWLTRLLEEPLSRYGVDELGTAPTAKVHETDDELAVSIEVPGFDRDELDVRLTPEGLTVRGERRAETDDEYTHRHFILTVPLPPGLDLDRPEARISRGVLTIRFPRTPTRPGARRIPVRA